MYTLKWNEFIKKMVSEKWNRFSYSREFFESSTDVHTDVDNISAEALWIKDYYYAVASTESIIGDIRIAIMSIMSSPEQDNVSFWEKHFTKCAVSIISTSLDGSEVVEEMLAIMQREIDRFPDTIDFRASTELLSEDDTFLVKDNLRRAFKSIESSVSVASCDSKYAYEEQDNVNGLFVSYSTHRGNYLGGSSFLSSITPIGFNQDVETRENFNINSSNIIIPFNKPIPYKYLEKKAS